MIRYSLRCEHRHDFEAWFRSSDAYDALRAEGRVACSECGSTVVGKAPMAPALSPADKALTRGRPLAATDTPREAALQKLRQEVEANSDYVGLRFVDEARAMHQGSVPQRAIHGEARIEDARKLVDEGVPVAPLPFLPRQKAN